MSRPCPPRSWSEPFWFLGVPGASPTSVGGSTSRSSCSARIFSSTWFTSTTGTRTRTATAAGRTCSVSWPAWIRVARVTNTRWLWRGLRWSCTTAWPSCWRIPCSGPARATRPTRCWTAGTAPTARPPSEGTPQGHLGTPRGQPGAVALRGERDFCDFGGGLSVTSSGSGSSLVVLCHLCCPCVTFWGPWGWWHPGVVALGGTGWV